MAGIYIHIPYCKQACHYCNFHFSTNLSTSTALVEAIVQEINLRKTYLTNNAIETIYFGGGTPGILSEAAIASIMDAIRLHFTIEQHAEITIEVNPDDMHAQKLKAYLGQGFNRLSVGTQSFFQEDLSYMNRSHDAQAAITCVHTAQDAGFANISLDLIYGFPLLSDAKWHSNVHKAFDLQVQHLSCYAMTVEPRTALQNMIATKKEKPIVHAQSAQQFTDLMQWLQQHSWEHYEISNCAKPNSRAQHNTNYWLGKPYIGFGPSAHSFDGNSRQWNVANNAQYITAINKQSIPCEVETLSATQQINEYIMTSLRMKDGMQLQKIKNVCTAKQWKLFETELQKHNALLLNDGHVVALTNEGKLFADGIASDLFIGFD
jgi:oxygen-independent coproporphyrinogen III oxidase